MPVTLITGAASGIGLATARHLSDAGYTVYGADINPVSGETFTLISTDVRDSDAVNACVAQVIAEAGHIDALVNNVGVGMIGALEETSVAEAQDLFDVNFFSMVRMTNAVLTHMREQGSGRIINVSSVDGLLSIPFQGMYSTTKFAVEGYTEALRMEVKPFGVQVSSLIAGGFKTNFSPRQPQTPISDYDSPRANMRDFFQTAIDAADDPAIAAEVIQTILESPRQRLRYTTGSQGRFVALMRRLLPPSWVEALTRRVLKLPG